LREEHRLRMFENTVLGKILGKFKKGPYISGIKAYNHLPYYLKMLVHNSSAFISSLKRFMCQHAFYSVEEYYEYIDNIN
jgi:hypothetical protein